MSGYVYLIGSTTFGWFKIGKSVTPEIRIRNLGILLPFKIEVLAVWKAHNHHLMENYLHEMYDSKRINGEWFEFSKKEVLELIKRIPEETRVSSADNFSNISSDTKSNSLVTGLKIQKLRGNFTPEERDARRIASIAEQKLRRQQKKLKQNRETSL